MSTLENLDLQVVPGRFAVCRLASQASVPEWVSGGLFVSAARTGEELSIVCDFTTVPFGIERDGPFALLRVAGSMMLNLTGILSSILVPLAEAGVPIFAQSTFNTDYVLVPEADLARAVAALRGAGHRVDGA